MGIKILAIHDGHNASAAVFDGRRLVSAISEERLNREKFYWGFPTLSIAQALSDAGMEMDDIEAIAVSHLGAGAYARRKLSALSTYDPRFFLGHLYNVFVSFARERTIRKLAGRREVYFCDHHRAHAASAYYFGESDEALVVTIDALGDQLSHTAYEVKNDVWKPLAYGGASASLGAFYASVTEGLGFRANRHEGKVVGLAALGDPDGAKEYISDLVTLDTDGLSFRRAPYASMKGAVERALRNGVSRESIAACAQNKLEELVIAHVRALLKKTDVRYLVCAGGVFANVKLNQRLLEECGVEDFFIQPAMGDEGLVLGAALAYLSARGETGLVAPLDSLYLGNAASESDVRRAAQAAGLAVEELNDPARDTAHLVTTGRIVGWFDGRMEFGPRALGHRSILADPRTRGINEILNTRLHRSDFMPFAPSVLAERATEIFDVRGAKLAAEFMTITMNVRPAWRERVPAIVHADHTARPQLVERGRNPHYYDVIQAFAEHTGIPLVLNTSFNIHEEPIVSSAEDALRSLRVGAVDCIVFNNKYLVRGEKSRA